MATITHYIKTWPDYFKKVESGMKSFELRIDDRDYRVGDRVIMEEYDPNTSSYTGKQLQVTITYILKKFNGLDHGYCVFNWKNVEWSGTSDDRSHFDLNWARDNEEKLIETYGKGWLAIKDKQVLEFYSIDRYSADSALNNCLQKYKEGGFAFACCGVEPTHVRV